MTFRRPPRPPRERVLPQPVPEHLRKRVRMATPELLAAPAAEQARGTAVAPKAKPHRSRALRDCARDEQCLVRMPGCIGHQPGATIWSHYRGSAGGKGMGRKSDDICGAFGCTYCDAVYDGQRPAPAGWSREQVELAWFEGHIRSLARLHERGML